MHKEFWFTGQVGGCAVNVFWVPDLRDEDDDMLDGLWKTSENEIWIHARLKKHPSRARVTVMHEFFHVAEDELHVKIKHDDIQRLASVAVQVLTSLPTTDD